MSAESTVNPLLAGVRVLDVSRLLPGAFCSQYLAQMGAEVIKIEEPEGGDYAREMPELFAVINRGKKSVTLDLRKIEDREIFIALVHSADVVLESFRPGVMDRLGCGYEELRKHNPRLVYAALTGYGQTGPWKDRAGHDMNYLATAGVLDQIGAAGGPPALSNVQIADLAGGALTCVIGILGALYGARSSGVGSFVDVSMTDGSLALNVAALSALRARGQAEPRGADLLSGALPNYSLYRCRGGGYLAVGALEPKFFTRVLQGLWTLSPKPLRSVLDRIMSGRSARGSRGEGKSGSGSKMALPGRLGELSQQPAKARMYLAPLRLALTAIFRTRTRDQWAALLNGDDQCVTPILRLEEALEHEQLRARGMVEEAGGKPAFALPIRFSHPPAPCGDSPALGADNESVLSGIG
jgi:alpha-methylacyl-CoA racemase